jgi:hypothetical protein
MPLILRGAPYDIEIVSDSGSLVDIIRIALWHCCSSGDLEVIEFA